MRYLPFTLALCAALCASQADSQTFTTLVQFTRNGGKADGFVPWGSLTLVGTSLYGMTAHGGTRGYGNVFSVGIDGSSYQNLLSLTGSGGAASGEYPYGSLTLVGASLYGMTQQGGANSIGNVFGVGINGANYQNLISFTGSGGTANGSLPNGSLTLVGTALYGMTPDGGPYVGNLFSVGTDGTNYQNLVSFTDGTGTADGYEPLGSLTLVGTSLYGMTLGGGNNDYGNIFSVGTDGTNYQSLVSFSGSGTGGTANGKWPNGSLTLVGSSLYGMTEHGGTGGYGNVFSVGTDGTSYQNLLSFTGSGGTANGWGPAGSLTLVGTSLYGMTAGGGYGNGNIFSVGLDGSGYRDLYDFTQNYATYAGGTDGFLPEGDLLFSGGTLFGMTMGGGANDAGTVFALVIPEPGTPALVGTAAVALIAYRWRRRRKRSGQWTVHSGQQ